MDTSIYLFCADWCAACRTLQGLKPLHLDVELIWIDIDSFGLNVDDLDIETFPTLAIHRSGSWVYWGGCNPLWAQIIRVALVANMTIDDKLRSRLEKIRLYS